MRPKPGKGWQQLSGVVWENKAAGVRIHTGGLILENAAAIHTKHIVTWASLWPTHQQWDRHTRIAGGSGKRGLMTLALEIAKGGGGVKPRRIYHCKACGELFSRSKDSPNKKHQCAEPKCQKMCCDRCSSIYADGKRYCRCTGELT